MGGSMIWEQVFCLEGSAKRVERPIADKEQPFHVPIWTPFYSAELLAKALTETPKSSSAIDIGYRCLFDTETVVLWKAALHGLELGSIWIQHSLCCGHNHVSP